ncbi:MAG TPA: molybdopterin dinucleotide binding domain-containing protein, partial [Acetobacteraceae bacterium]|nr:molybdopterin dinucleotide binding domain-containing protein [Acetobacteraceae bacterium]
FEVADVLLLVGANPLLSLSTFNFPLQNPARRLRDAKARGLKLIVIDPRRTETAIQADHFLQPWPGEDPALLAGLLHIILESGWQDQAFCDRYVTGLDALREATRAFTPDYVAARAGIAPQDLLAAAAAFAAPMPDGRRKRGSAASGTGPDMAPHANLAEHLLECLNVVCGRYARPGDLVPNPGVLGPRRRCRAQVIPPRRGFADKAGAGPGGYGLLFGERMTGALADDILADHPARLRALIVDGGNPVSAMPETRRAAAALGALDLLVTIDPFLTPTARLSDYVIPPRMMLERAEVGDCDYESIITFAPYGSYSPPVVEPPTGSDLVDDWVVLWELARRLGLTLRLGGEAQDLASRPSAEELIARLLQDSAVPFAELRRTPGGRIYPGDPLTVEEAEPANEARFDVAPADVLTELAGARQARKDAAFTATHRFAGRRLRDVQNSMYHHLPGVRARMGENLAYLHSRDLAGLGIAADEKISITSAHGHITAAVRADDALRPGVIAMAHLWGGLPDETTTEPGVNTNLLTSATTGRDPINAMPVLTGFPVRVERAF